MDPMKKEKITIDDLATLMKQGFARVDKKMDERFAKAEKDTDRKIDDLATMVQNGFMSAREDLLVVKAELKNDISRLENVVMGNYERRLERVEDNVRLLKTKAGIK